MAFGRHHVQFLHVSDLHARGQREKEPWRRRRVLGPAWRRNLEILVQQEGSADFIFFTGDAAQSGKPEEYDEASDFFLTLCKEIGIGLKLPTVKADRRVFLDRKDLDEWIETGKSQ